MTWHLTPDESRALEQRVLAQVYADAREIIARNPDITDRRLVLMLVRQGYTVHELGRIADMEWRHA
jgi:hypothetical protein